MRRIAGDKRGGYALLRLLSRLGLLNQYARFEFADDQHIVLPLTLHGVVEPDFFDWYERDAIAQFVAAIERMAQPPVLFDCGADVGLYTRLVLSRTSYLAAVVAIEPNQQAFPILEDNLAGVLECVDLRQSAVGLASGRGRLAAPYYDKNAQSHFVQTSEDGELKIESIDEILHGRNPSALAIKADVEGAELAVLQGPCVPCKAPLALLCNLRRIQA